MLNILSVIYSFIRLANISHRTLTMLEYPIVVYAVCVIIGNRNEASLGALDFQNAFFFICRIALVIENLDSGVLIVNVRACFIHILIEIGAK